MPKILIVENIQAYHKLYVDASKGLDSFPPWSELKSAPRDAEKYCETCIYRNYKRFFICHECRWNHSFKDNCVEEEGGKQ
jgi:hypothetical protein